MDYIYPGFDKLDAESAAFYALPLCDMLKSLIGDADFSYIGAALHPLELVELILHHLEFSKNTDRALIDAFSAKYLTEDSLCPIGDLISLWGAPKFDQMIKELQAIV